MEDNDGEGSTGSTYAWVITGGNFQGTTVPLTASGNQVHINWTGSEPGTYTLTVTESNEFGCVDEETLTIVLEDCTCENPPGVSIEAEESICSNENLALTATLTNATSVTWSTSGDGTFDDINAITTTYTPGANDLATGAFTITATTEEPEDELCNAGTNSIDIEIIETVEADFAQTTFNICDVDDFELPTPTNNVAGTWDQEFDGAGAYIFTPDAECNIPTTITVNVNDPENVTFNDLPTDSVCVEAQLPDLSDLPEESAEGQAGEWSVSNDEEDVFTYTFTPTDDCYLPYTFTVNVTDSEPTDFEAYASQDICSVDELLDVEDLPALDDNSVAGTWGMNVENDVYTYTFTPTDADCYEIFSFSYTLIECECPNPPSVTIDASTEICAEDELELTATLTNATSVTWSTSGDGTFDDINAITTTYTPGANDLATGAFTITATTEEPEDELCNAGTNSIDIEIIETVEAEFAQTEFDICEGDEFTLPTPTNNVVGSWNADFDGAGTYTFTPESSCGEPTEITVNVNDPINPVFEELGDLQVCNQSEIPVIADLPTQDDNALEGVWTVETVATNEYLFTFTPNDDCTNVYTFTVVNLPPYPIEFEQYNNINICDEADLPVVSEMPETDDNGISGTWSSTTSGAVTTYTFTPSTMCYTAFAFTVTLFDPIAVNFNNLPTGDVCTENQLPSLSDLPFESTEGHDGVWTVSDNGEGEFTYTFTPDNNCYLPYTYIVNVTGTQPTVFAAYTSQDICSLDELLNVEELAELDDNAVTGTWSVNVENDVYTYTFTPTDAECYEEFSFSYTLIDCDCTNPPSVTIDASNEICEGQFLTVTANLTNAVSVTWSTSGDGTFNDINAITTTYTPGPTDLANGTFTISATTEDPEDELCNAGTNSIDIEINESVEAEFAQTTFDICEGDEFTLPSPTNGVAGTWDQAFDGAGTYIFTPESDCGIPTTITVNVTEEVQAEFAQSTYEICEGDEFTLPSPTNDVAGTWDQAFTGAGT
ncbi:MAG: hypothetical protein Q4F57_06995, partial [Weeksellaceae bacterium]|nr:hypothetical protein [Weeksellaceae bacterium]